MFLDEWGVPFGKQVRLRQPGEGRTAGVGVLPVGLPKPSTGPGREGQQAGASDG